MEAEKRFEIDPVISGAEEYDPQDFTLFALLRRLEQEQPDKPRLGSARRPISDVASLHQAPNLKFKGSEVVSVTRDGPVPVVRQNGLGVMGPMGALPLHLTEWIFEQENLERDSSLADFVNLIQRRLISLVYRAWSAVDPVSNYDRHDADEFRLFVGALAGVSEKGATTEDGLDARSMLGNVGLFARSTRPADALETLIHSYFGVRVRVHPFAPEWIEIPSPLWSRLGSESGDRLGQGVTLGRRSWQCQYSFEVEIGPLSLDEFREFLPDEEALGSLRKLVIQFAGHEWSWRVRLVLKESSVPKVQLGRPLQTTSGSKLGWDSWLGAAPAGAPGVVIRGASEVLA